jgi:hypothetical protein
MHLGEHEYQRKHRQMGDRRCRDIGAYEPPQFHLLVLLLVFLLILRLIRL